MEGPIGIGRVPGQDESFQHAAAEILFPRGTDRLSGSQRSTEFGRPAMTGTTLASAISSTGKMTVTGGSRGIHGNQTIRLRQQATHNFHRYLVIADIFRMFVVMQPAGITRASVSERDAADHAGWNFRLVPATLALHRFRHNASGIWRTVRIVQRR